VSLFIYLFKIVFIRSKRPRRRRSRRSRPMIRSLPNLPRFAKTKIVIK